MSSKRGFRKSRLLPVNRVAAIILFCTVLLFCSSGVSNGQESRLMFEHLTSKEGLSHSAVSCIVEDNHGYMWIGTNSGLNKFNGYNFEIFLNDPKDSKTISSNRISSLFVDSKNNLWVGTLIGGLNLYSEETNSFIRFTTNSDVPSSISSNHIRDIFEDSKGRLWIATRGGGLNRLISIEKGFKRYVHDPEDPGSLMNDNVFSIIEDDQVSIWIGTNGGGIHRYNEENDNFQYFAFSRPNSLNLSPGSFGVRLCNDHKGNIWVGTENEGLYCFSTKHNTFKHYLYGTSDRHLNSKVITGILLFNKNELWISTDGGGINSLNLTDQRFSYIIKNPYDATSLSNNQVQFIYEDFQQNIWVGNYNGGLNIYFRNKWKFEHYRQKLNDENSLSHNAVLCFEEDSDGNIWIGTDGGGLNRFDPKKGTFQHFRHNENKRNSISGDIVKCITEDNNGLLWIGTYEEGLNIYNRENNSIKHYRNNPDDPYSISSNHVWYIFQDSRGDMYFGTLNGLNRYDRGNDRFIRFFSNSDKPNNISSSGVMCMCEDSFDNLWIGTDGGGLNIMDREKGTFKFYINIENDSTSLSNNFVKVIIEDSQRNLWIGTMGGGLNRFERATGIFTAYTTDNNLPSNNIIGIIEDGDHNLWLSTSNGICRFNYLTLEVRNYNMDDGLQDMEFIYSSFLKAGNGDCYFGGINGFNRFRPKKLSDNSHIPPVVLTNFYLFNRKVEIGGQDGILRTSLSNTDEIKLSYNQNVFGIEFAALDYTSPKNNRYRYRMENFDKEWIEVDADHRMATYTNLNAGEYIFKVIASNNDDIWNDIGTSIKIIISPPFWQTWWFRIAVVMVSLAAILAIFFIRMAQIRKRNIYLKKEVQKRTKELNTKNKLLVEQTMELNETNVLMEERQQQIEEQAEEISTANEQLVTTNDKLSELNAMKDKFFSIIGHDLKNPINVIMGFSEMLKMRIAELSVEKRDLYIDNIFISATKTYNLLENILDWARSQSGHMVIQPESTDLIQLISSNIQLLKEQTQEKQITVSTEYPEVIKKAFCDGNMTDTIIRNLLSNAIKFTQTGGKITVIVTIDEKSKLIKTVVSDTGIGIPSEKINKLFSLDRSFSTEGTSGETGTGLGLIMCKEFVEKNGGSIGVESVIDKGSKFYFTLPVDR